jgi:hypothetical protein
MYHRRMFLPFRNNEISTPQQQNFHTVTAKFLHRNSKISTPQQQNFLTAHWNFHRCRNFVATV